MAKQINIKTGKTQLFGRAPLLNNEKQSNAAKALRYYKYQMLFNHYHPPLNYKSTVSKPVVQQLQIVEENTTQPIKTKWFEAVPHWIVELFTRDKSNQEILSTSI